MFAKGILLVSTCLFVCVSLLMPVGADAAGAHMKSAGCKTEFFLLKDLSAAYQNKTGTKLRAASTGNKKAMNLMLAKDIDFSFTCKPIGKLSKKLKLDPAKVGHWKSIPIAKDPVVVVSNSQNGVSNLSVEQLTNIFQGKVTNWDQVGGANLPISVSYIDPETESGSLLLFKEFTVGGKGELAADAKILGGPSMLGNYVSRTPGGVTFMPLNSYQGQYGAIVAIDGVIPSRQSIEDGSYRLTATYYLTVDGNKNEAIDAFISYCMSEDGQQVIANNFVPYSK